MAPQTDKQAVTASRKPIVPAAMLRRHEKWLKAIKAGDIKAALKAGGHTLMLGDMEPELQATDVDIGIAKLLDNAKSAKHIQHLDDITQQPDNIKTLQTEIDSDLLAFKADGEGMSMRLRATRLKAMAGKLSKLESMTSSLRELVGMTAWLTADARIHRSAEFPFLCASSAEAMLRAGNQDGLRAALLQWGAPKRRFQRGFLANNHKVGWTSCQYLPDEVSFLHAGVTQLVSLAAIRGDNVALRTLVEAGLCPTSDFGWWDQHDALLRLDESSVGYRPLLQKALKQYGMARGGLEAAAKRLARQADLCEALEDAFDSGTYQKTGRKKVPGLLKKGAAVGYFALAQATAEGDLEMLEALFAAGGDPNSVYKDGIPILSKLRHAPQDAVKVWLKHGACPLIFHDPDSPDFGNDRCPSPLYQAVREGNVDMTRLLLEESIIAPAIAYKQGRKHVNPMAKLAKDRGHTKLAAYLVDYAARMKA